MQAGVISLGAVSHPCHPPMGLAVLMATICGSHRALAHLEVSLVVEDTPRTSGGRQSVLDMPLVNTNPNSDSLHSSRVSEPRVSEAHRVVISVPSLCSPWFVFVYTCGRPLPLEFFPLTSLISFYQLPFVSPTHQMRCPQ